MTLSGAGRDAGGRADTSDTSVTHSAGCSSATLSVPELARLVDVALPECAELEGVCFPLRRYDARRAILRSGDLFRSLYVVRRGFFKQALLTSGGAEQVVGFPMPGDVIGAEGLDTGVHLTEVVSLSNAEVAILPFGQLNGLGNRFSCVRRLVARMLGKELSQAIEGVSMLGTLGATARVAQFLTHYSKRMAASGASRVAFDLQMTRAELASFLGIALETVSRTLNALANAGLIEIHQRAIRIRDSAGLKALIEDSRPSVLARGASAATMARLAGQSGNRSRVIRFTQGGATLASQPTNDNQAHRGMET